MNASRLPRPLIALLLALGATLFAFTAQSGSVLHSLDLRLYDIGLVQRAPQTPRDLVILGLDERFMRGRHAFLAPRDRLARLLEILVAAKPRAIALDVWLDSPIEPKGDSRLQNALRGAKKAGVPIVLSDLPTAQNEWESDSRTGQTARGAVIPPFKNAAQGAGSVLFNPDEDGAIRRHQSEKSASLPLQMARFGGAKNLDLNRFQREDVPLDFCGPPRTVATQSAADFLENPILAALLENKLVFIGATYPRSRDFLLTPYSFRGAAPMYGVELLAQATDSLRRGAPRHSHDNAPARLFDFALVFVAAILVAVAALRGTMAGVVAMLLVAIGAVMVAALSSRDGGALWGFRFHPATPFLLAMPLAATGGIAWRSFVTARELALVRDTFGAYMGDDFLQTLGGKMPELGGETRAIAVLFCDIRGYSALAETMSDPRELLDELNAHFAPLVSALKKRGAYVDNYVGDLVMALFGAPVSSGDFGADVRAAVAAALDFVELVEERNRKRREMGQIPIEVGIGVHCGLAVVGNLGSRDAQSGGKIHYTALGDVVNVASRVESATREHDVALLVTREVVETAGAGAAWNRIGEIAVKGRAAPVEVWEVGSQVTGS